MIEEYKESEGEGWVGSRVLTLLSTFSDSARNGGKPLDHLNSLARNKNRKSEAGGLGFLVPWPTPSPFSAAPQGREGEKQ